MKKYILLSAGFLSAVLFCACSSTAEIRVPEQAVRLDVRTQAEYAARSIPGSILIPHDEIAKKITAKIPDKNTPIALYCRSGRRSAIAAGELKKLGYTRVLDLGSFDNAKKVLMRKK